MKEEKYEGQNQYKYKQQHAQIIQNQKEDQGYKGKNHFHVFIAIHDTGI
jgi:hypothetical protein